MTAPELQHEHQENAHDREEMLRIPLEFQPNIVTPGESIDGSVVDPVTHHEARPG